MITYNKLYGKVSSYENLLSAFLKARKGKSGKYYVMEFQLNLQDNLLKLQEELKSKTYYPGKLKKFIIRDPKTRTIHASIFRDRVVHHAVINLLEPIFEKRFISDSFAGRKEKGTHIAVRRFETFVRKVSDNGKLIANSYNNNSIRGYVLKADIKHYFDTIDHETLITIIRKKVDDEDLIWLIRQILDNFKTPIKGKGLPLGNYTSQFFANVYLNEFDYFIKHELKAKYYIRYVDDFVILHQHKRILEYYLLRIKKYLPSLKIELHPEKSEIHPLRNGITFLGYRVFYHYRLLRRRNIRYFMRKLDENIALYSNKIISWDQLGARLDGWFGYAKWADTYNLRQKVITKISDLSSIKNLQPKSI